MSHVWEPLVPGAHALVVYYHSSDRQVVLAFQADVQRLNIQYYVARPFYWLCGNLIGIKFDVEGEEHLLGLASARDGKSQSAMLISNHQR